uniref:Peptidase M24 domain-containing protein n=1 Tax=Nannospalax galili TaxID=1026970 RepID=A0A8C6QVX2_NANGA
MSGENEQQKQTITEDLVVTKYKMGSDIANWVLQSLVEASSLGVSVLSLCEKDDDMIMEEKGKIFKKEKEMKESIVFPTSTLVNNYVCFFSPLKSDQDYIFKEDDLVKIDLGVHVDGFIANLDHTFVIGVAQGTQVTGWKEDVIKTAHLCAEAPGTKLHTFNCTPIEHMLSYHLKQHAIDGEKTIIQGPTDQQKKDCEKGEFEVHEIYALDVLISSGEGKAKDEGQRTIIYE